MTHHLNQIIAEEDGQTAVEYALVVLLIALAVTAFGLGPAAVVDPPGLCLCRKAVAPHVQTEDFP